jgi:CDP-diacylglycerol--serine O-phosphatidyltransferase
VRRRRARRPLPRAAVPSAFTLGNLLSGFFSIVRASEGDFQTAAWLIVLAAFFDLLDGMVARIARGDSRFGLELDSLCDVVSFGVAPSFLLYQFGLKDFPFGAFIASLPALTGAVRLARFNTMEVSEKRPYFNGLPIPAQAGTIVAFILTFRHEGWFSSLEGGRLSILLPLSVLLSALMVSPIRFAALPQPTRTNLRRYRWRFAAFVLGLVLVLLLKEVGLLISAAVYLALGIGGALVWAVRVARSGGDEAPEVPPSETL